MRLTTACVLLLLACAACATSGKVLPTVENNVVSYRSFRDVTIASNYTLHESQGKDVQASARDELTMTTSRDMAMVTFYYKNTDVLPAAINLIYSSLPDRWQFIQHDEDFYMRLGGHEYRALVQRDKLDEEPYTMLAVYYYPQENRQQMIVYYFPEKSFPEELNDDESRKNYVISKLQEAIVEF